MSQGRLKSLTIYLPTTAECVRLRREIASSPRGAKVTIAWKNASVTMRKKEWNKVVIVDNERMTA